YDGCGNLVTAMKTGAIPDVFGACDKSFMEEVKQHFPGAIDISTNQLVLVVPKGNPKQIKSLQDLSRPGLRIGVGHEKQCALGALTKETFDRIPGLSKTVKKNVAVVSTSADQLVNA